MALLDRVHVVHETTCQRASRLAHDTGDALSAAEHHLELFKRTASSLWVEEKDNGQDDSGDDEEDEVVLPTDCLNRHGRNHVDNKIPQPVVGGLSVR